MEDGQHREKGRGKMERFSETKWYIKMVIIVNSGEISNTNMIFGDLRSRGRA